MGWRQWAGVVAIILAVQITGNWLMAREVRKQSAWQVAESYAACRGKWNPWEKQP